MSLTVGTGPFGHRPTDRFDFEPELVRDRICFYQERPEVEVEVDGALAERPRTPWSATDWIER